MSSEIMLVTGPAGAGISGQGRNGGAGAPYVAAATGGGGGGVNAGGGGAGGFRYANSYTITASNDYTVTVGAGGSGGLANANGGSGGDSTFNNITSTGGGGGGGWGVGNGLAGGSGGGAPGYPDGSTGGVGTSGQGNNGGNGDTSVRNAGGGGGGAGAVGGNSANSGDFGGSGGIAGNGGSGTTAPTTALEVAGNINSTATTGNSSFSGDVRIVGTLYGGSPLKVAGGLNLTSGTIYTATNTADNLSINVNNTLFVNSSSSRVGINTATPASALDVSGTLTVEGINVTGRLTGDNTTQLALLGQKLNLTGGTLSGALNVSGTNAANNLSLTANDTLYFNTSASRVGIGTSSPTQALHVVGSLNVTGSIWSNDANISAFTNVSVTYGYNGSNFVPVLTTGAGILRLSTTQATATDLSGTESTGNSLKLSGNLTVLKNLSVGTTTLFVDQTATRIGIGTASPTATLEVSGSNIVNNISLNVNNTFYVNNSGGGFVGIRTASPSSVLQVAGNASISGTLLVNGVNVSGSQAADNTTLAALLGQKLNLTGGTLSSLLTISAADTTNNLSLNVNSKLYVNSSTTANSVGIGTSSPLAPLHVYNALGGGNNDRILQFWAEPAFPQTYGITFHGNSSSGIYTFFGMNAGEENKTIMTFNRANGNVGMNAGNFTIQAPPTQGNNTWSFIYDSAGTCVSRRGWNGTHVYDGPC